MTHKERILHTVLFELFGLCLFVPLAIAFTGENATHMTILSVLLSLIAMLWNYVYNFLFDEIYGGDRLKRSFGMRMCHGLCFELGLTLLTVPLIMYVLNLGFRAALILDIGVVIFFLVYAIIYNWCYDITRKHVFKLDYSNP